MSLEYNELETDLHTLQTSWNTTEVCLEGVREKLEPGLVVKGGSGALRIACRDLGILAWGIRENKIYFRTRYSIDAIYHQDLGGGGPQSVSIIEKGGCEKDYILGVVFSPLRPWSCFIESEYIYEADLIMDGRKELDPQKNHGRTKFGASSATLRMGNAEEVLSWINGSYLPWMADLSRLSRPHSTIAEWVNSELDMGVYCSDYCVRDVKVIENAMLASHMAAGLTLDALKERLSCRKCGRRRPQLLPF